MRIGRGTAGWLVRCCIVLTICLWVQRAGRAHDVPIQLPVPESDGEAWNVVEQSKANIDQLLTANLMRDVAAQLANISGAMRFLRNQNHNNDAINPLCDKLLADEQGLLRLSRLPANAQSQTRDAWKNWCETLNKLEQLYPASTVHAEVYICPMHPLDRHLKADEKCTICGMALVRRRLPASGVYQKPGEPTLKMTLGVESALRMGEPAKAFMRLTKPDGSPVVLDDLVETHTKKIHLLINDGSLSDYHHEHPQPTTRPGEYSFSFTPAKPGPYRVWADLVPAASGVQEYVVADLPGKGSSLPITDRTDLFHGELNGRKYDLTFDIQGKPITQNQTVVGTISVRGSDGKGFTALEPVMGAFAHLVAFNEDGKTILHIHPYGREPRGPGDRAGPVFAFKFYAPMAGFYRLYCQVQIDGKQQFVPFALNVEPAKLP